MNQREKDGCINNEVSSFYRGRAVFITGATGFMGKVLVEKLLISCSGIKCLYLLMRPKGNNNVQDRLVELANSKVFEVIKRDSPELLKKMVAIAGDISQSGLGISSDDEKTLVENVSVVFHSAATVRFDEILKTAVEMNLKGTMRVVELCRKLKLLEAFVHVSTAYANCNKHVIDEIIYPLLMDPHKLMECVDWMDESLINNITHNLLENRPNTYTYTKALAEHLLKKECGDMPVVIVRPSIVTAALNEPTPGWIDNINGPTGLIIGAGKGALRTIYCPGENVVDIIPVEFPINMMIAVAWHTAKYRPKDILVYNCATGYHNPLSMSEFESLGREALLKYPLSDLMWYPGGSFKNQRWHHNMDVFMYHYIPAYAYDFFRHLRGKRPFLVRLYDKAHRAMATFEFFITNNWKFITNNSINLMKDMSAEDRRVFYFDVRKINWPLYLEKYALGARQFILKDDPSSLPVARKKLQKMYWLQQVTRIALLLLLWWLLIARFDTGRRMWNSASTMLFSASQTMYPGIKSVLSK